MTEGDIAFIVGGLGLTCSLVLAKVQLFSMRRRISALEKQASAPRPPPGGPYRTAAVRADEPQATPDDELLRALVIVNDLFRAKQLTAYDYRETLERIEELAAARTGKKHHAS